VYGTLIAFIAVYFLWCNYRENRLEEINIKSTQHELILPEPGITRGYYEIIRYLHSIQDFYPHNEEAYTEMMKGFENFFKVYEDSYIMPRYAGRNYEMMVDQKRKSMNALHSIIYNLPVHFQYTNKLERAIGAIDEILQKYLDQVENLQKVYLHENEYNVDTNVINNTGILPFNAINGKDSSYEGFGPSHNYGNRLGQVDNEFTYELV
jgi:hypothetical protein